MGEGREGVDDHAALGVGLGDDARVDAEDAEVGLFCGGFSDCIRPSEQARWIAYRGQSIRQA